MTLDDLVADFARGIERADARRPVALNQRSKAPFRPGIGPHAEAKTVELVMAELSALHPTRYGNLGIGVSYPAQPRQKCDLCLGTVDNWSWAIEVKMLRFLGDNGQPNDSILMHILSPYPEHRSALTDCLKLAASGLTGRKAILIYGYDAEDWPLAPAIDAFEVLARARVGISPRASAQFANLVHPVHRQGGVFGWELTAPA